MSEQKYKRVEFSEEEGKLLTTELEALLSKYSAVLVPQPSFKDVGDFGYIISVKDISLVKRIPVEEPIISPLNDELIQEAESIEEAPKAE